MPLPMTSLRIQVVSILSLALCIGCGGSQPPAEEAPQPAAEPPAEPPAEAAPAETASAEPEKAPEAAPAAAPATVEVTFQAKSGSKLAGKATLTETPEGVKVALALEGVKPGDHGAHVHEKGDCSAPDAASAGGHFNPGTHPHALPANSPRHLGDLGNITIGKDGKGTLEIVAPAANLKANDPNSFLGKSIIVHEKKDDGGQPTGNAGGRIGCAEIK
jgi:superoxide dismutase, Cu-Zn family